MINCTAKQSGVRFTLTFKLRLQLLGKVRNLRWDTSGVIPVQVFDMSWAAMLELRVAQNVEVADTITCMVTFEKWKKTLAKINLSGWIPYAVAMQATIYPAVEVKVDLKLSGTLRSVTKKIFVGVCLGCTAEVIFAHSLVLGANSALTMSHSNDGVIRGNPPKDDRVTLSFFQFLRVKLNPVCPDISGMSCTGLPIPILPPMLDPLCRPVRGRPLLDSTRFRVPDQVRGSGRTSVHLPEFVLPCLSRSHLLC